MSLLFNSPMPKKYQAFFFAYTLTIMALFALVGIQIAKFHYGVAGILLAATLLIVGIGFMIRKRTLRKLGMIPTDKQ